MISVYVILFLLLGLVSYLFYLNNKLNKLLKAQDVAHKKALAEAGNAITDTLKVAFENIKQHNAKIGRLDKKIADYQPRFNRLEQHAARNIKSDIARKTEENVKFPINKDKILSENENE